VDTEQPGSGPGQEGTPSEADVREYVQRLRSLPVEQVIGDIMFTLLNAAQVKLGRRDARLLIDLTTVAHEHARAYLPDELTKQVDQALGQLRMGQVTAEGQASRPAEAEENDLGRVPAPPSAGAAQPAAERPASRLWVPGQP
jgi:hypothetical protein